MTRNLKTVGGCIVGKGFKLEALASLRAGPCAFKFAAALHPSSQHMCYCLPHTCPGHRRSTLTGQVGLTQPSAVRVLCLHLSTGRRDIVTMPAGSFKSAPTL
eukprot:3940974-Rhodomonas_salina.1